MVLKDSLRLILSDDTVTVDMEVMTLKGGHIFKQDKHSGEKGFIPWSKNTPPPAFLKESKEDTAQKLFLEVIFDQDLTPNFRPKQPWEMPQRSKIIGQSIC